MLMQDKTGLCAFPSTSPTPPPPPLEGVSDYDTAFIYGKKKFAFQGNLYLNFVDPSKFSTQGQQQVQGQQKHEENTWQRLENMNNCAT